MARSRLRAARSAVAEAEAALAGLKDTRDKARALAGELAHEVETLIGVAFDISASRAETIKAALRSGTQPSFGAVPAIERNAAARADAESKLQASRMVIDELD